MSGQQAIQSTILDEVRQGFATVSRMAKHVRINHDRLKEYSAMLLPVPRDHVFDTGHHFIGSEEETACYTLVLDSINFGSGYEPFLLAEGWQRVDNGLYYTIATRLKHYFEKEGVPSAALLQAITAGDICRILELDPQGQHSHEFAQLCAQSLQELGRVISSDYSGRFLSFVVAANGSAQNMVSLLLRMHYFNDVHSYKGLTIPLYKRAQITAADLHLAFRHLGHTLFHDIEKLTMFPDNGVPHVLRMDGILTYTPALLARIEAGEEIPSGSEEEVEIRACAGHVVEEIARIKNMSAMDVDHILWHRSAENPFYKDAPTHRTRSLFY